MQVQNDQIETIIFVVKMFRWGEDEEHNYILGVFSSFQLAEAAGKSEREYRGGKYEPRITMWKLDVPLKK